MVYRSARAGLRLTRAQRRRLLGLPVSAGDVWCCVLELNAWRRARQATPLAGYQELCRELAASRPGTFGELDTTGARSVLRRYSDAWFAAAKRPWAGDVTARFPRRRRRMVPVRALRAECRQHLRDAKARHRAVAHRAPKPGQRGSRRWRKHRRRQRMAEACHARRIRQAQHEAARKVVAWAQQRKVGTLAVGDPRGVLALAAGRRHNQRTRAWRIGHLLRVLHDKAETAGIIVRLWMSGEPPPPARPAASAFPSRRASHVLPVMWPNRAPRSACGRQHRCPHWRRHHTGRPPGRCHAPPSRGPPASGVTGTA